MKNQYFGDRRDYVKYDLLLDLVDCRPNRRVTYIPMLTNNDDSYEGLKTTFQAGCRRTTVHNFLQGAVANGQRDIRMNRQLMLEHKIEFMPYCDDCYFDARFRREYFDKIPTDWLGDSLVFIDPDIGLKPASMGEEAALTSEKYLLNSDVQSVFQRMSEESILFIYQHLQRNAMRRLDDLARKLSDLIDTLICEHVAAIAQSDVAFLIVVRDEGIARQVESTLEHHAMRHGMFTL